MKREELVRSAFGSLLQRHALFRLRDSALKCAVVRGCALGGGGGVTLSSWRTRVCGAFLPCKGVRHTCQAAVSLRERPRSSHQSGVAGHNFSTILGRRRSSGQTKRNGPFFRFRLSWLVCRPPPCGKGGCYKSPVVTNKLAFSFQIQGGRDFSRPFLPPPPTHHQPDRPAAAPNRLRTYVSPDPSLAALPLS